MVKKLWYSHQWIDDLDIKEVSKTLRSDFLTQGPAVEEFEKKIANYCGAKYAVAFSSATAALHGACFATGISRDDEVIVPTYTFVASANCVVYQGGTPVLCDVEEKTFNVDPKEIEKKITPHTKAVISVDFAGRPADYESVLKLVKEHNLTLIEDASQALGGTWNGKKIGSFADMTVFSFHPVKSITTGEGGMIVTNNKNFYEKLKIFRTHGIIKSGRDGPWHQEMVELGYNYRLSDIHASLGLSQLKKIKSFLARRRSIAQKYIDSLTRLEGITTPPPSSESAWHLFVILLKNSGSRKKIFEKMRGNGLLVQVHYLPVHLHPFYRKNYSYKKGDFPVAESLYMGAISVPLFPQMTDNDVNFVIKTIKSILL